MTPQRTRRTVLGSIASLTALAGCLDLGGPGTGADSDFDSVGVDGTTLTVRVADDSAISKVNVIAPDDSLAWERDLAAGARKVTIDIGLSYQPGTHRIVGLDGDTTVSETTIDIAPDLEITRVAVGANHLGEMPEEQPFKEDEALVAVRNRGNGPRGIEQLLFFGDVPNPSEDLESPDNNDSGIWDTDDGYGSMKAPKIPPNSESVFYTSSKPFAGDGSRDCNGENSEGEFTVQLVPIIGKQSIEARFDITFSGADTGRECDIEIQKSG